MSVPPETEQEHWLLEHAVAGTELDLGPPPASSDDRRIRGAFVRALLVGNDYPIHERGVRIRGACIADPLDLSYTEVRVPVVLRECVFADHLNLRHARLATFAITGSELRGAYLTE